MTNKKNFYPRKKDPRSADTTCALGGFSGDEDFYLQYVESLMNGDIRPYILKNYVEEKR